MADLPTGLEPTFDPGKQPGAELRPAAGAGGRAVTGAATTAAGPVQGPSQPTHTDLIWATASSQAALDDPSLSVPDRQSYLEAEAATYTAAAHLGVEEATAEEYAAEPSTGLAELCPPDGRPQPDRTSAWHPAERAGRWAETAEASRPPRPRRTTGCDRHRCRTRPGQAGQARDRLAACRARPAEAAEPEAGL